MEPHELAIAALNQFARNTNYREKAESGRTNNNISSYNTSANSRPLITSDNLPKLCGQLKEHQDNFHPELQSDGSNPPSTIGGRLSTPPTSTSDIIPSQEISSQDAPSQLSQLSDLAAVQDPFHNALATPLTAGQKRTADGYVKSESPTSSASQDNYNHSRKISTPSNNSTSSNTKIEELTSGLRTRLSYAMFKVSYGWQSNSIDEVESLASQMGSPSSAPSILQGRCHFDPSPRAAIASTRQKGDSRTQAVSTDFNNYCRLEQPSRTYESFWRDHSVSENLNYRSSSNTQIRSSPASRALAPPAEICTSSSRGSGTPKRYNKAHVKHNYGSSTPGSVACPETPQRIELQQSFSINSSSQTTSQEQDAIETLMFMSSPGNLNNLGHVLPQPKAQISPQKSPLRGEIYTQSKGGLGRKINIGKDQSNCNGDKISDESEKHKSFSNQVMHDQDQRRSAVIKCLLDEMGESSSDEGDDFILNNGTTSSTTTPHRVSAGRI